MLPFLLMFIALLLHIGLTISTNIDPQVILLGFLVAIWIILAPTLWWYFKFLWHEEGRR